MICKFFEYKRADKSEDFKPIKSFYLKDTLNPKVWDDFNIDKDIRDQLLQIADDYIKGLDFEELEVSDVILTGSLSNYNWSEYSDFDLHIVFDFNQINKDSILVKKYLDAAGWQWNNQHDILIMGYEVELYSQDVKESHISSGQFSLLNNKWIEKPTKDNFIPDEDLIRKKSGYIMDQIDELESEISTKFNYDKISEKIKKLWKKVKDNRKSGLSKDGEFSIENLVFKLLRRNEYIKKLIDIKTKVYDTQFK